MNSRSFGRNFTNISIIIFRTQKYQIFTLILILLSSCIKHEKIIKIGTNIVHFFVNNVNIPEKFTKFDIPALISSSIDNIFSFQNVIDNLSTGEIIVISSFSIGSLIISLIASLYTYRRRRLYLLKQARKQRERANLRSVNLLLRNRKPDSP